MAATIYDITIEQGADWSLLLAWKDGAGEPVDIAGYTARMQVRETYASKTKVFDLTTENGRITLPGGGTIELIIPSELSAAVHINPSKTAWVNGKLTQPLVYDLELEDADGKVTRLIQGAALFVPEVTR